MRTWSELKGLSKVANLQHGGDLCVSQVGIFGPPRQP
jgi:hypothetical protein